MIKYIWLCLLLVSVSSCSRSPISGGDYTFENMPDFASDESLIVVVKEGRNYSRDMQGNHWIVSVDNEKVGDIFEGYYLPIVVKEGRHSLSVHIPLMEKSMYQPGFLGRKTIHLEAERGKTYYARLELVGDSLIPSPIVKEISFRLIPWNQGEALLSNKTRIMGMKYNKLKFPEMK